MTKRIVWHSVAPSTACGGPDSPATASQSEDLRDDSETDAGTADVAEPAGQRGEGPAGARA
jgi:hypothetical protein